MSKLKIFGRQGVLFLVVAAVLSTLVACSSPPAPTPPVQPPAGAQPTAAAPAPAGQPAAPAQPTAAPAAAPKPTPIAKARIGVSTQIISLDPATPVNAASAQVMVLSSGQLYRFDLKHVPVPELAEKADVSADGKTVTMTLKSGITYSDGTPVKTDDVLFMLDQARKGPWSNRYAPVESASAPDDHTIVWKMKAPYPNFFSILADFISVIHPKAKVQADKDYFLHPVSAGPYIVKQWTPGTPSMLLEANPKYVGGQMMVNQVELVVVADLTSRVLQLATGALDYAYDLPPSSIDSLPKEAKGLPAPIGGMYHITINLGKPGPLSDPKVRQAISLAIDRAEVNQKAFFGISKPASAFLYEGVPEHEPILANGGKRDLAAAKQLLASTEYAKGFEFTMQTWGARPGWKDASLVIAGNLKELGITVKVDPVEDAVALDNLRSGNFEAQFSGNAGLPTIMLGNYFTPGVLWNDAARYKNLEVAGLIEKAATEVDANRRKALTTQLQKLAAQDFPHIPISERAVLVGTRLPNDIIAAVNNDQFFRVKNVAEMSK